MFVLIYSICFSPVQNSYAQQGQDPLSEYLLNQKMQVRLTNSHSSLSTIVSTDASSVAAQIHNKSFDRYTNPILGISIEHPSNWSIVEDTIMNRVTFTAPSNTSETTQVQHEYLQIGFIPSNNLTLDQWLNKTLYEYEQDSSLHSFDSQAITSFGFNGYVDRTIWYSFTKDDISREDIKAKDIFFIANGKLYRVRYVPSLNYSEELSFHNLLSPVAKTMLDSFVIINANRQMAPTTERSVTLSSEDRKLLLTKPVVLTSKDQAEPDKSRPQLAISERGDLYAVWYGTNSSGSDYTGFIKSTGGGVSADKMYKLDDVDFQSNSDFGPQIGISGNKVYVLWNGDRVPVLFKHSEDGGTSFSNNATGWGEEGDDEITSGKLVLYKNSVYVLLYSLEDSPHPISLVRSNDGGRSFQSPVNISSNEVGGGDTGDPQLVISDNGNIYVTWYNGEDNDVMISRSTNGGASFSAPLQVLNDGSTLLPIMSKI
jgi:hypothetical protein